MDVQTWSLMHDIHSECVLTKYEIVPSGSLSARRDVEATHGIAIHPPL